ncbi:MAG: helix-turn-helix domain-containing protein [Oscillospiraceae bacterium]|nr:helix-turn-helix domain-containing protein [Oscillospiraceae bacterium]
MSVYFSEKFKQLRKDKDLTQEQIADIFHVSPQSVSRWETGANYPDVEILPHLAIFFKVTVDELLGTEAILGEEKAKEYIRDIRNLLNSGKVNESIELARKAVKEYPLNYDLQGLLMHALITGNSDGKFKDEIISISERIINNNPNNLGIKWELIRQYSIGGMKEEAKKIVYTLPSEAYFTQDLTMKYVLEGEELTNDLKLRIIRFTIILCDLIGMYANTADLDLLQTIECMKAVQQIENLALPIAGEKTDHINNAFNNIHIAKLYCEASEIENALLYVEKAVQDSMYHLEIMYTPDEHGNNSFPWSTPRNLPWILWKDHLMKPQFDIIRNDERFIKCFELLKANSHELK